MYPNGLPDDVPEQFCRSVAKFNFVEATPVAAAKFDRPMLVSSSMPPAMASAAWNAIRAKSQATRERVANGEATPKT